MSALGKLTQLTRTLHPPHHHWVHTLRIWGSEPENLATLGQKGQRSSRGWEVGGEVPQTHLGVPDVPPQLRNPRLASSGPLGRGRHLSIITATTQPALPIGTGDRGRGHNVRVCPCVRPSQCSWGSGFLILRFSYERFSGD